MPVRLVSALSTRLSSLLSGKDVLKDELCCGNYLYCTIKTFFLCSVLYDN